MCFIPNLITTIDTLRVEPLFYTERVTLIAGFL
jgi:hypothetical protein